MKFPIKTRKKEKKDKNISSENKNKDSTSKFLLENPWSNVYWFARMLINTDQYAGIGKDTNRLIKVGSEITTLLNANRDEPESKIIPIVHNCIQKCFLDGKKQGTNIRKSIENFISDIQDKILTRTDALIFAYTCNKIVSLSNLAVDNVPSNDREFTLEVGKTILETEGSDGLKILINTWDDLGVKGCLEAERTQVMDVYQVIKKDLSNLDDIDDYGIDLTLTALVQEMERRLGQKRKGRGGKSLEDVTTLILDHFNIESCSAPDHFQADIEVDKWIKTKRNFYIGISCKRTLRERWKQVSSADMSNMGRYKITEIIHLITYSRDLSDDKLALLGGHRHVFYLPDDDPTLQHHKNHPTLSGYVHPMSKFIDDLMDKIENS